MNENLSDEIPKKKNGGKRENTGGARPGCGRKQFSPTEEESAFVREKAGHGVPLYQVAMLVRDGVDYETFMRVFRKDILAGKGLANAAVGKALFNKAVVDGDTTCLSLFAKTQMGFTEKQIHEHTGADGGAIEIKRIERKIIE